MKKFISLALVALTTLSMWADVVMEVPAGTFTKAIPTAGTNGIYFTRAAGTTKKVTINSVDYLAPNECGFVFTLQYPSEIKLATARNSGTSTWSTCNLYLASDMLVELYKCAAANNKTLSAELITWKDSSDAKKTYYESMAITKAEDASNKLLMGETAGKFTAVEGVTKKDKVGTDTTSIGSFAAGVYVLYLKFGDSSLGLASILLAQSCTPVVDPLTLKLDTTKSESEGLYVGDKIKLTIGGTGNGAAQELMLDGAAFSGTEWTATAGEHTFALSQEVNAGACGTDIEIKLSVAEKKPVTAANITGVASVVVNKEVTLTCEAENATDYQWYKGTEKIDGATDATYTFKPDAAGEVTFYCEAKNKFNTDPVKSAGFKVTVTDAPEECGVLAKIEATAYNKAQISGLFAGTASAKMSSKSSEKADHDGHTGYKLNTTDTYLGADFTEGTLKAKDKVIVFVTTVSEKLEIYSDKGSTLIASTDQVVLGENILVLGESAEGAKGLYVYRTAAAGKAMNPYVAYIALKRKCAGESDDASVTSFKINDQDVSAEGGTYSYEVPEDYMGTEIEVKFELAAGATADQTSPLKIKVPNAGETTEVKITVTAQDGDTKVVYTVKVSKAAAPKSTDASITELKINNEVVAEKEGAFAYEVAAEAALDSVEVVFTVAEKATAAPASPFKMLVPEAGAAATEAAIKVTAEDGTTVKEYKVSVTKAKKAEEALDNVADETKAVKVIRDGQLYILKNGVLYNAQGTAL